jgi:hypothetical protein
LGTILTFLEKYFYSNSNRLSLTIAFVLLTVAVSMVEFQIGPIIISFSSLLVCMMLGHGFLQLLPAFLRSDGTCGPLDGTPLLPVLRAQRSRAELGVFKNPAIIASASSIFIPVSSANILALSAARDHEMRAERPEVSGDYPSAAGGCRAWHVHRRIFPRRI